MTEHDKTVLSVAKKHLVDGWKGITVGDRVVDRVKICLRLKKLFPKSKIRTYLSGHKVEFLGGRMVRI